MWILIIVAVGSYLLGSFPSGYIAGKIAGIDVRKHGSGNIGATNVLRVLGKKYGYAVFFCDALKGLLAVRIALLLVNRIEMPHDYGDFFGILAAVACVLGHTFPVWLKFKGGKGVATSAGTMFGLMPLAMVAVFLVWVIVFELTRYVSVASVTAAIALPITIGVFLRLHLTDSSVILYSTVLLAIVVCWRHRSNFTRLIKGTEQRFNRK